MIHWTPNEALYVFAGVCGIAMGAVMIGGLVGSIGGLLDDLGEYLWRRITRR